MHIKEISLEGFKSYATRTVVPGFDPFFNAITGLNGSGKSNILDSICFVLGITNLQQVRASNLQELVYKQGQAGVTKATVSIIFDNTDSSRSPIGYEECSEITVTRQIVVGGRNKYLINGHLAQPIRVQNLFHSVQLNVNNPHFLIMQGRITKVLNMKPPEILSMLEEAAGTRMYEMKKDVALKTLLKKQTKVDEINSVLSQEILPALEKLRKERAQYINWVNGNAELDRLKRFCIAFEFFKAEKIKNAAIHDVESMQCSITESQKAVKDLNDEISEKEKTISDLTLEKEKSMSNDIHKLSDKVDQLSSMLVKETSVYSNQKDTLKTEKAAIKKLERNIKDLEAFYAEKCAEILKIDNDAAGLKSKVEMLTSNLVEFEKEYQGVQAGKSGGHEEKSLADQLSEMKVAAGKAMTESKQAKTRIHHLEEELKERKRQLASKKEEANALDKELQSKRTEIEKIRNALSCIPIEEGRLESLEKLKEQELEAIGKLEAEINEISAQLGSMNFHYSDPVKNFERTRVKGVVARLMHVKDIMAATALEVAAGGKLYNVVVDSEQTGKMLLERGNLKRRITMIPLNKIESNTISTRTQDVASRLVGHGNVTPALSLVGYEEELKVAMCYVFGGTFVCKNTDAARQVTFHKDIKVPSVSLEGDIFDPRGLLTGGARKGSGNLLKQLHRLSVAESELAKHRAKLSEVEAEIRSLLPSHKRYDQLKSQLELKSYDLALSEERAKECEHHKLSEAVSQLGQDLDAATAEFSAKEELCKSCLEKVTSLEQAIKDHGRDRESRLFALEKQIKAVKQQLSVSAKELKGFSGQKERLMMEKEAIAQEQSSLEAQLSSSKEQVKVMEESLETHALQVDAIKKEYMIAEEQLKESRTKIKECDSEINSLTRAVNKLQQKKTDWQVEIRKMENEIKRMESEQVECSRVFEKLLQMHKWITTEKQLFGKPGTDYDFSSRDPTTARAELDARESEQSNIEKRINKKVITMFEKAEDEYNSLIFKKQIIENDKSKIHKVIHELDEKKKETLKITWQKVNKDFGSIFSTLLPGTTAKLVPPEGGNVMDGLEVRVAFGSVWKQSLSELSGGQRSLLALSLILALLLFKPAPLYILDEVDAALDLSHTQNIGRMIKAHFPHSQFIVVSLKEGMFNNANVIFRTKFVDGVSTVTRTVPDAKQQRKKLGSTPERRMPLKENTVR
ncbi:hypothetical protein KP509_12G044400 [Ceratopteris richardii]|uniref:Structural maintenance of chromosomes protein n=1 Tax=Ceratopteris richardii TaxID=49495 RepID=A0A8T2TND0_CERRI|nr:hypothetical protein KP509_12G044400 [Ceratopteris richardii]KAH7423212.1 hypothetical protein KP509_12G044400 [Ceratopteris richardii]KAH7423213.1 hypothetical protein KP509_12G044400 [Ceratopteris richardii]KAH7423214.1 hypothetical protein KP509_12G044400 [Ceratopteris richardii]KAH7423216.1 hypothetical protein KP509_12G044400 [Ceratopteris richardii]